MYLGCCAIFKIYFIDKHIISSIIKSNIIQRAKSEIDNTLLKDEDFHKYLLYHTKFYFILKRNKSSYFHTLCCKKTFFLSCSKTHFEPNVGSSIAISEPIIAGLVLATESPNSMKLGNLVQ